MILPERCFRRFLVHNPALRSPVIRPIIATAQPQLIDLIRVNFPPKYHLGDLLWDHHGVCSCGRTYARRAIKYMTLCGQGDYF